jgi:hypothetical protein
MTPNLHATTEAPAPRADLAELLVKTLQLVGRLRTSVAAFREALQVSIGMLAEKDQQIDRLRNQNAHLRGEIRKLVAQRAATGRAA